MSVTVSGLSGLTNAYTSVLSATGSLDVSGASRCDDMSYLTRLEWETIDRTAAAGHRAARASRAARSGSRSRVRLVPEKMSISPDRSSRRGTTTGSQAEAGDGFAGASGSRDREAAGVAAARAGAVRAMAAAASPAAPAPAALHRIERRDGPSCG